MLLFQIYNIYVFFKSLFQETKESPPCIIRRGSPQKGANDSAPMHRWTFHRRDCSFVKRVTATPILSMAVYHPQCSTECWRSSVPMAIPAFLELGNSVTSAQLVLRTTTSAGSNPGTSTHRQIPTLYITPEITWRKCLQPPCTALKCTPLIVQLGIQPPKFHKGNIRKHSVQLLKSCTANIDQGSWKT